MNKTLCFAVTLAGTAGILWLTTTTAQSQFGAPKAFVNLQPTTPGTSQSGHGNISGTMRAGQFIGGGAGLTGITANALALPYTGSGTVNTPPNALFKLTNLGTGLGIHVVSGVISGSPGVTSAIAGESQNGYGIFGRSNASWGVYGLSNLSYGVVGRSDVANFGGVFGLTTNAGAYGVRAEAPNFGIWGDATATTGEAYGVSGTNSSSSGAGVYGLNQHASGSFAHGVRGESTGTSGRGVYGLASGASGVTIGVQGDSGSPTGRGIYGVANSLSGLNYGVYGLSSSPTGYGVFGITGDLIGTGVRGQTSRGIGVWGDASGTGVFISYGVQGTSAADSGRGVYGHATDLNSTNYGVYGESESTLGYGVKGLSPYRGGELESTGGVTTTIGAAHFGSNGFSITYGSYSQGDSDAGTVYGAYGNALGSGVSMLGVYGNSASLTNSGADYGVYGSVGDDVSAFGVYGVASSTTGVVYGVRGVQSSGTGFGLYAIGDTGASGTKSFVIDHPADPLNKYLRHYSMEAPKPWNLYRGSITTDTTGNAWVELPEYYSSINIEPTIHLTVRDDSEDFVLAKVVGEVKNNRFRIKTNKPGVMVSWLLIADRNDPWVQAHPTKVEYDKPRDERGKLQAPEAYGYPKGMAVDQPLVHDTPKPSSRSSKK